MHSRLRKIVFLSLLLSIIIVFQLIHLPVIIRGIIVNAALLMAGLSAGLSGAVLLCILSPITAYITGSVPPPFIPVLPAIAVGNIVYSVIYIKTDRFYMRVLFSAVFKAGVITAGAYIASAVLGLNIPVKLLGPGVFLSQTFTALIGAVITDTLKAHSERSKGDKYKYEG